MATVSEPSVMGMTTQQQKTRKPGTPGAFSRWVQRTMNARTNAKIRRGRAHLMGMDVLILNTVGQRIVAAQPRYAKYQKKSDRQYPVIRLTPR